MRLQMKVIQPMNAPLATIRSVEGDCAVRDREARRPLASANSPSTTSALTPKCPLAPWMISQTCFSTSSEQLLNRQRQFVQLLSQMMRLTSCAPLTGSLLSAHRLSCASHPPKMSPCQKCNMKTSMNASNS